MRMDVTEQELLREIEAIDAVLNQQSLTFYEIRKSLNILKSENHRYYLNIAAKLFLDIRDIYIEQLPVKNLYPKLDRALSLAIHLEKQVKSQFVERIPTLRPAQESERELVC
ncbi:hypothetical protein [Litoribacillus peritrichatus]|uniref:Uncharacterized protein n=1 Tax=Litoribacillus peritrichatus TaxID=718191 RepID=A0ABP7MQ37_9GAMM